MLFIWVREGLNLEQDPVSLGKFGQCVLHERSMLLPSYEGRTKSHGQQFCIRTGNSRQWRVLSQMELAVVLIFSVDG